MFYPFPCLIPDRKEAGCFLYLSFDTASSFATPCQARGQVGYYLSLFVVYI